MKILLNTVLHSLSFSSARLVIISSKPEALLCRSRKLFTIHLHQINQAVTIAVKIMTDFKSFLSHMIRKFITFFNIFTNLAARSIIFVGTSGTYHRVKLRSN